MPVTPAHGELTQGFGELRKSNDAVVARVDSLEKRTLDLKAQVGSLKPERTKGLECHYCHATDHLVADCPVLKEKKEKEAAAKKGDGP